MNKNTYHFAFLRLNDYPQTRISSQDNTPGFSSLEECKNFCEKIGFGYTIYYFDDNGKKIKV